MLYRRTCQLQSRHEEMLVGSAQPEHFGVHCCMLVSRGPCGPQHFTVACIFAITKQYDFGAVLGFDHSLASDCVSQHAK